MKEVPSDHMCWGAMAPSVVAKALCIYLPLLVVTGNYCNKKFHRDAVEYSKKTSWQDSAAEMTIIKYDAVVTSIPYNETLMKLWLQLRVALGKVHYVPT